MARRATILNVFWSAALFWARFGINAVVFVVMVRWIAPEEIGAYGAAFGLIQIVMAVQTSGLPEALIQSEDQSADYANTAFWLSAGLGVLLAALVFVSAPAIGWITESDRAEEFARVLSIIPLVTGFGAVPEAIIRQRLQMAKLAARTTLTLTAGGLLAIVLAAEGWGGAALIALTLINNVGASLLNILLAPWRPAFRFTRALVWPMAKIATSISARNVVKSILNPSTQMLVTAFLGTAAGGIYFMAVRFETILSSLSLMPVQYAALPMFTRVRNDLARRSKAFVDAVGAMSAIASPVFLGMAAIAPTFLPILLGASGDDVAPVVQGLSFHAPVLVLTNLATPALVSVGRAGDTLRFTALQALLNIVFTSLAAQFSVAAVAWTYGLLNFLIAPLLLAYIARHVGAQRSGVAMATLRPWIAAVLMAAAVWSLHFAFEPGRHDAVLLGSQIALGLVLYPLLLVLIAPAHARLLRSLAASLVNGRK